MANSSMLVLPMTIAPASRRRARKGASRGGWLSSSASDPAVVGRSTVSKLSCTATGTQNSGPRNAPPAVPRSSASACATAWGLSARKALSGGPRLVSRSRAAISARTARIASAQDPGARSWADAVCAKRRSDESASSARGEGWWATVMALMRLRLPGRDAGPGTRRSARSPLPGLEIPITIRQEQQQTSEVGRAER